MPNPDILKEPFFQVTIPLAGTLIATALAMISTNNHRLTDMRDMFNKRFDLIEKRSDSQFADIREILREIKVAVRDVEKRVDSVERKVDVFETRAWAR